MRYLFQRHSIPFFLLLLIPFLLPAQTAVHSMVRVTADRAEMEKLGQAGLMPDHADWQGSSFTAAYKVEEVEELRQLGVGVEVLQADLASFYENRLLEPASNQRTAGVAATPAAFNYGSMGGYLTYDEVLLELDSMAMNYPNLVTVRDSIGTTHEGRALWMVKISDNPNVDETEPEVLYNGIHHAREPMSMMNLVYYMQYLLENYGTDPEATYIVDNREMYFVPIVNPDGYVYNQTTNPNGGGMWRKNRRVMGGGDFGVDLNRNYDYEWGHDNSGSSPDPNSDLYRGPSAFSEPETQAMRDFCIAREFKTGFSYHSYGDLYIHPWGYDSNAPLPDQGRFDEFSDLLNEFNAYRAGNAVQTVGYDANGVTDDWMYGEQVLKGKMMTFTPEVGDGSDGFWPAQSRILPLNDENIIPNLRMAWLAGDYIDAQPDPALEVQGTAISLPVDYKNIGLASSSTFTSEFIITDPNVTGTNGPLTLPALAEGGVVRDSFALTLAAGITPGTQICGVVRTTVSNSLIQEDTVCFTYGLRQTVFIDSTNSQPFQWTGGWNTTTEKAYSGTLSITDSPFSLYAAGNTNTIDIAQPIDLTNYIGPVLNFQGQWEIEAGWDYCQVLASTNGSNYTPLAGQFTVTANGFSQPQGEPIYEGNQGTWALENIDLSAYAGQQLYLRFEMVSDQFLHLDGFYFDDLEVRGYSTSVGIEDEALSASMFLYPNPSNGLVKVGGEFAGAATLQVMDLRGALISKSTVRKGDALDWNSLPAGMYLYRFEVDGAAGQTRKLIVD